MNDDTFAMAELGLLLEWLKSVISADYGLNLYARVDSKSYANVCIFRKRPFSFNTLPFSDKSKVSLPNQLPFNYPVFSLSAQVCSVRGVIAINLFPGNGDALLFSVAHEKTKFEKSTKTKGVIIEISRSYCGTKLVECIIEYLQIFSSELFDNFSIFLDVDGKIMTNRNDTNIYGNKSPIHYRIMRKKEKNQQLKIVIVDNKSPTFTHLDGLQYLKQILFGVNWEKIGFIINIDKGWGSFFEYCFDITDSTFELDGSIYLTMRFVQEDVEKTKLIEIIQEALENNKSTVQEETTHDEKRDRITRSILSIVSQSNNPDFVLQCFKMLDIQLQDPKKKKSGIFRA